MNVKFCFKLLASAVALMSLWGCEAEQQAAPPPGPPEVEVVTLKQSDITLTTELPGRTSAVRTAQIRPQVNGIIVKRLFREGAEIEAGEQLYQIDDAPYKAAYSTAQARVAEAKANFVAARAREKRYKDLLGNGAVSQQDYDDALASFMQAEAAQMSADAAVETARINLEYTKVLAPISGRIGKSAVTEGALVTAGQAQPLAVISQLDPIYVDVSQSVGEMLDIRRQIIQGSLTNGDNAQVRLTFDDGTPYPQVGSLAFSEVAVNESTGTVVMRAVFPNPQQLLLPGMFVRAEIVEGQRANSLLVPQRAVSYSRQGDATAMVVNGEGLAELRNIRTGRAIGSDWLVLEGLQAGERVIIAGLQKIAPGAPVTTVEAQAPAGSAAQADRAPAQAGGN